MAKKTTEPVVITGVKRDFIGFTLYGLSHWIPEKFPQSVIDKMVRDQTGGKVPTKGAKEPRDPDRERFESLHLLPARNKAEEKHDKSAWLKRLGMPSVAVKQSAVNAARFTEMSMVEARGMMFFEAHPDDPEGMLLRVEADDLVERTDIVRVGNARTAMPAFRYGIVNPRVEGVVSFPSNMLNAQSVANLLTMAGELVGVMGWRPLGVKGTGPFGRYRIELKELPKMSGPWTDSFKKRKIL